MSSLAITRTIVVAILLGAPGAGSAFCQVAIDQLVDERPASGMRFGSLTLSPTLEVMTGLDTNVFNEVEDPKSDLMTSVSPGGTCGCGSAERGWPSAGMPTSTFSTATRVNDR